MGVEEGVISKGTLLQTQFFPNSFVFLGLCAQQGQTSINGGDDSPFLAGSSVSRVLGLQVSIGHLLDDIGVDSKGGPSRAMKHNEQKGGRGRGDHVRHKPQHQTTLEKARTSLSRKNM